MPDDSAQELRQLLNSGRQMVGFDLECLDCGRGAYAYTFFGFDPELKFPCDKCGSRNTERS